MLDCIFLKFHYSKMGVFAWATTEETVSFALHKDDLDRLKKTVGKVIRLMSSEKYYDVYFDLTVCGDLIGEYRTELYIKADYHLQQDGTYGISEIGYWETRERHVSKSRVIDACIGVYLAAKAERERQLAELEQAKAV